MPYKPKISHSTFEELTRARDSRYVREQRVRRIVIIGVIVIVAMVALLIGAFLVQQYVLAPNQAVAVVGGQTITASQLQQRMRYELAEATYNYNQLAQQVQTLQQRNTQSDTNNDFLVQFYTQQLQQIGARIEAGQIGQKALDSLVNDALIRQEAQRRGIAVSPQEVQQEIESSTGYYRATLTPFPTFTPAPSPTPTPITATQLVTPSAPSTVTVTPPPTLGPPIQPTSISDAELDQVKTRGRDFYKALGYPESEFERAYESSLFANRLREEIGKEVPTEAPHYAFRYLRFNGLDSAISGTERLAGNQITFDALISETESITQPVVGNGGALNWTSRSSVEQQFGNEVLAALESTPLSQTSQLITSSLGGFYIVLPTGREVRPLEPSELDSAKQQAYSNWLTNAAADPARVQRLVEPAGLVPSSVRKSIEAFQNSVGSGTQAP